MIGAVLNTLNIRLDAEAIAFQLAHGEAKVLITDREFSGPYERALQLMERRPLVIDIDDKLHAGGTLLGEKDYEAFLEEGDPDFAWSLPEDEWQAIALNYTSGTTGNPKGVVYASPRSIPERFVEHRILGHAGTRGLSLDAAHVPLQWMVLSLVAWRPSPERMSVSGGLTRSWSSRRSAKMASPTCAAHRSSTTC